MLNLMMFYFWVVSPILYLLADILGPDIIGFDIDVAIVSVWLCMLILSFLTIFYLMNKYHKFEFETNIKSIIFLFLSIIGIAFLNLFLKIFGD